MCGIVGAVADRDIVPVLIDGLRRLEYRGYDSAGVAVLNGTGTIKRMRTVGKVRKLEDALEADPAHGKLGIAHTRWATHGVPSERNAHPHISRDGIAIVHNGIIENHEELRAELLRQGYEFASETDTEVIAHRIHYHLKITGDLFKAVRATAAELEGAYALAVMSQNDPDRIVLAREGCPVVIGLGKDENYVASDVAALLPVTRRFIILEEGDVAEIRRTSVRILDGNGNTVQRPAHESELSADSAEKGSFPHYMLKEIYEQPRAVAQTLQERVAGGKLLEAAFGPAATAVFARTEAVRIVACGTSFHAASVAKYFIEQICRLPCWVEIASEYRYRNPVVPRNTLFVSVSQSGETADTLAALRYAKAQGQKIIAVVNQPESSIAREADVVLPTLAGPEIGVASTKAFTTQLAVLASFTVALARARGAISHKREAELVGVMTEIPSRASDVLNHDERIREIAVEIAEARDVLYLGRGSAYPLALEGALKLKEISYIHAEGYAAGEMKHGPIALIDENVPVIVLAPHDDLFEKTLGNVEEVMARGGRVVMISDAAGVARLADRLAFGIAVPSCDPFVAPLLYAIPIQLLAYHVAVLKGTDVDQPRNLAKSVTVE